MIELGVQIISVIYALKVFIGDSLKEYKKYLSKDGCFFRLI